MGFDLLDALRLPPVKALEDGILLPLAGWMVLEDQQLGALELTLEGEGAAHLSGLFQACRTDDLDAPGGKKAVDLPVPHGHRAELRGHDQQRLRQPLELLQEAEGLAQHLREDDGICRRNLGAQLDRRQEFRFVDEQLLEPGELRLKLGVARQT